MAWAVYRCSVNEKVKNSKKMKSSVGKSPKSIYVPSRHSEISAMVEIARPMIVNLITSTELNIFCGLSPDFGSWFLRVWRRQQMGAPRLAVPICVDALGLSRQWAERAEVRQRY